MSTIKSLATVALTITPVASGATFHVAEVKPHYQCTESSGQDKVRDYIKSFAEQPEAGLIALIQMEFTLPPIDGYSAFGSVCQLASLPSYYHDPVVVLYKDDMFDVVKTFDGTAHGGVEDMPLINGKPWGGSTTSCLGVTSDGDRGYTGALLKHKASGQSFCMLAGTFPHAAPYGSGSLGETFLAAYEGICTGVPTLWVVDTNDPTRDMTALGQNMKASWGTCSDPGATGDYTCCHDVSKGHPEATLRFDRTAMCGGGSVSSWKVESNWYCNANEEHHFTQAVVNLEADNVIV